MILELELEKVPIDKAAGTCEIGIRAPKIGIKSKPAPPPQIALNENANRAQRKMIIKLDINALQI